MYDQELAAIVPKMAICYLCSQLNDSLVTRYSPWLNIFFRWVIQPYTSISCSAKSFPNCFTASCTFYQEMKGFCSFLKFSTIPPWFGFTKSPPPVTSNFSFILQLIYLPKSFRIKALPQMWLINKTIMFGFLERFQKSLNPISWIYKNL